MDLDSDGNCRWCHGTKFNQGAFFERWPCLECQPPAAAEAPKLGQVLIPNRRVEFGGAEFVYISGNWYAHAVGGQYWYELRPDEIPTSVYEALTT